MPSPGAVQILTPQLSAGLALCISNWSPGGAKPAAVAEGEHQESLARVTNSSPHTSSQTTKPRIFLGKVRKLYSLANMCEKEHH